jgi:DNA-binding response OmpR family regulator
MADKKRILIVDDEMETTDYLKEYLQGQGLEVSTAGSGEQALELLASFQPSLVLLDMRMGKGLSGLEVIRRAKSAKSQAQFVVVTGIDDQNVAKMAIGLGATDYLTKPFRIADLDRIVLARLK